MFLKKGILPDNRRKTGIIFRR